MTTMNTLIIATQNKGKKAEIAALLRDFPVTVKSLDDFGPIPDVVEDGATFEENAYKKASFTARVLGYPALADDSGLTVAALDGAPGVYSARWAGPDATDAQKCRHLLEQLEHETRRDAAFECVISIAVPSGAALTYEGRCEGLILREPAGSNGFGYDPIFFYPPLGKSFAQLSMAEKSAVSHRGKALYEVREEFDRIMKWVDRQMPAPVPIGCQGRPRAT